LLYQRNGRSDSFLDEDYQRDLPIVERGVNESWVGKVDKCFPDVGDDGNDISSSGEIHIKGPVGFQATLNANSVQKSASIAIVANVEVGKGGIKSPVAKADDLIEILTPLWVAATVPNLIPQLLKIRSSSLKVT